MESIKELALKAMNKKLERERQKQDQYIQYLETTIDNLSTEILEIVMESIRKEIL